MKPSRFILNSLYATLTNDANGVLNLTIPPSFTLPAGSTTPPLSATLNIGKTSAGMRMTLTSSKYPGVALAGSIWLVDCTATYTSFVSGSQETADSSLYVWAYRSAPSQVKLVVMPNVPAVANPNYPITITNAAQTLSLNVSTFLSPFES